MDADVSLNDDRRRPMMRQLHGVHALDPNVAGVMFFGSADLSQRTTTTRFSASTPAVKLPTRPDASAINPSIPLFYIGRNSKGAWVACAADGQSGGLFVLKQSAARFARRQCAPAGCAIMYLAAPLELDIGRDGKGAPVSMQSGAIPFAKAAAGLVDAMIKTWRRFIAHLTSMRDAGYRNRAAVERDLFHGQYALTSKNDDDLPVL
jgi:hypothetical protein